ncbi:MAG: alpha/beta hydrolase [Deltaproteobacteria bacterium]|nr:alpha/beta hydrolase [Deltaproteobacteria bacterium]
MAKPALILFAPGAGAGSDSLWMRGWRERLATVGDVETLDYPYRRAGRKAPDKLPVLIAAHRQALLAARALQDPAHKVVLAGKSMGGRVGCHVAAEERVDAIVCLGYPLRSGSGALRDEVLLALRTPILFVQGTRDPLCPLDVLMTVRARMTAPNELLVVEGGNHSLEVPRRRQPRQTLRDPGGAAVPDPQQESDARVLAAIAAFVSTVSTVD